MQLAASADIFRITFTEPRYRQIATEQREASRLFIEGCLQRSVVRYLPPAPIQRSRHCYLLAFFLMSFYIFLMEPGVLIVVVSLNVRPTNLACDRTVRSELYFWFPSCRTPPTAVVAPMQERRQVARSPEKPRSPPAAKRCVKFEFDCISASYPVLTKC